MQLLAAQNLSVSLKSSGRQTAKMDSGSHVANGTTPGRNAVDLDRLIQDFNLWQEATADVLKENDQLSNQLKGLHKQCSLHQQAAKASSDDSTLLRTTIDKLHSILAKRCDMEDENVRLKEQIAAMQSSATQLEEEHRKQMAEALENLQAVHEAHKKEMTQLQTVANEHLRQEVESLQRTIQEKSGEIRQLQKQLTDLERDKHTEVVKLRLEYDAKLLKLQKQNSKAQCGQPSSVNHEIFRKKLQNAKAEADREITSMRRRIADLERQLALVTRKRKL